MRISPDGTHVLFSQIQLVPNPLGTLLASLRPYQSWAC